MRGRKRKRGHQWCRLRMREAGARGRGHVGRGSGVEWPRAQVKDLLGAGQRGGDCSEGLSRGREENAPGF